MVQHPHGCLGSVNGNFTKFQREAPKIKQVGGKTLIAKPFAVPFGDSTDFGFSLENSKLNRIPPIFPVRDFDPPAKMGRTYESSRNTLNRSQNCVCIGLSPQGINSAKFDFSSFTKVYHSGSAEEELPVNFSSYDLYAKPLIEELCR